MERKSKTKMATKISKEDQNPFFGFKTLKTILILDVLENLASWWL
jgi:hypothetical protein